MLTIWVWWYVLFYNKGVKPFGIFYSKYIKVYHKRLVLTKRNDAVKALHRELYVSYKHLIMDISVIYYTPQPKIIVHKEKIQCSKHRIL